MAAEVPFRRSPWTGAAGQGELDRWLKVAEGVAAEVAPGALRRDRDNALPVAEVGVLRESGLLNLLIPAIAGGEGGHFKTAFHVVRTVARADPSLGTILGYH